MGFFDRKKEGDLMDIIRCDEKGYFVWKWRPSGEAGSTKKENAIRYGSSLRVKSGEVAVFCYQQQNGDAMDYIVGPHDETIKTANFPILTSIVGAAFGGKSPFQAEIYFINTESNNQLRFAVPYFDVTDPTQPRRGVPVAIRGSITFAIKDYKDFVDKNRLIDFDIDEFYAKIKSFVVKTIKSTVANAPYDYAIPLIQLDKRLDFISEVVSNKIKTRFIDYGVEMKYLDIDNFEIDKESEAYLALEMATADIDTRTILDQYNLVNKNSSDMQAINAENVAESMRIQREEVQRNQRLQTETNFLGAHSVNLQADVLKTAASGIGNMGVDLGGGGISGGFNPAGMMMGMALGGSMGGQMNNMMNQMGQQMHNSMSAPPPIPEVKYMLANNGQQFGPFDMMQMAQLVQNGQMTKNTYVWKQGMAVWELAGNVQELASLFMQTTPPPPPGGMPTPPSASSL